MAGVSWSVIEPWFSAGLAEAPRLWWTGALAGARRGGLSGDDFAAAWSGAGRRLGRAVIEIGQEGEATLRAEGAPFVPAGWGTDELGRAILLLAAADTTRDPAKVVVAVDDLFRMGEMREQQAVLRVLGHLPEPSRYIDLAADAVRSNVVPVLEAIACENPFPSAHVPEPAFNQLVMKCLFNGVALGRVQGLDVRNNAELRRIVGDYVQERRAAGRVVPADVALILLS
jgi:hypothetical protein